MREFGPNVFQRLEQASKARSLLLTQAQEIHLSRRFDVEISPVETAHRSSRWKLPKPMLSTLGAALLAMSGCNDNQTPLSGNSTFLDYPVYAKEGYLLGGPHSDGLTKGKRAGLDFGLPEIVPCPGGEPLKNRFVIASASGKVAVVGNEKDPTDENHSIVEIDHEQGFTTGYMHLANILVSKGQEVIQGQKLGNPSCEVPPGGGTDGIHVHWYVKRNGKYIPADGIIFSQGKVAAGKENYNGTITSPDGTVRTADRRRCGPDEYSIQVCGGIRNDLSSDEALESAVKTQPTSTHSATARPTQTATRSPLPSSTPTLEPTRTPTKIPSVEIAVATGFTRYNSLVLPYQIDHLTDWSHFTLPNLPNSEFFMPNSAMDYSLNVEVATEKLNSWVSLDDYKNKFYSPNSLPNVQYTEPKSIRIDGKNAYIIERIVAINKIYHIYVVFIDKGIGWRITLQNTNSDKVSIDQSKAIFNRMAPSIHVR